MALFIFSACREPLAFINIDTAIVCWTLLKAIYANALEGIEAEDIISLTFFVFIRKTIELDTTIFLALTIVTIADISVAAVTIVSKGMKGSLG